MRQENQDEPNSVAAASVGLAEGSEAAGTRQDGFDDIETNQAGIDILNKMPGVNSSNVGALMVCHDIYTCDESLSDYYGLFLLLLQRNDYESQASAGSLAGLCTMTQQEMHAVMKSEANAKALYEFLHAKCPVIPHES